MYLDLKPSKTPEIVQSEFKKNCNLLKTNQEKGYMKYTIIYLKILKSYSMLEIEYLRKIES